MSLILAEEAFLGAASSIQHLSAKSARAMPMYHSTYTKVVGTDIYFEGRKLGNWGKKLPVVAKVWRTKHALARHTFGCCQLETLTLLAFRVQHGWFIGGV